MLKDLRLQNFRCFSDHTVPLRERSIVIGRNNAGKSTLVDALRLVAIVASRYQALHFRSPPKWGDLPKREVGLAPSLDGMDFNVENLFHRYGDPPAIITATFTSGVRIRIYVGPEAALHAVIYDAAGRIVTTRGAALGLSLNAVAIMPQVAPLAREEKILSTEHVRRNLFSSLAPLHFRNQLHLLREHLPGFRTLAEDSWPSLQVRDLTVIGPATDRSLRLMVRDESYVAEVGTMGHGLQMWLQTIWFLSRMPNTATVILDEPDVYMHPDLQRRLIRYVRDRFRQTVVTTHSVEIVSEVPSDDILIVDRRQSQSRYATSLPAVQRMVDHVGSVHNLQLARLWSARRCLLVEGDDFQVLCDLYDAFFPDDRDGLATSPNMSIGGWGGWNYAVGSSMLLKNAGGENIRVYCILDSDYHTPEQINERLAQAESHQVDLHIWSRKELENYLLVAPVIARTIAARAALRVVPPTEAEVATQLSAICDHLRDDVFDAIATEIRAHNRELGQGGANKLARTFLDDRWKTPDGRLAVIPGKTALSRLSQWCQEQFAVSLNPSAIARQFRAKDFAPELQSVLQAIASCASLPKRS